MAACEPNSEVMVQEFQVSLLNIVYYYYFYPFCISLFLSLKPDLAEERKKWNLLVIISFQIKHLYTMVLFQKLAHLSTETRCIPFFFF